MPVVERPERVGTHQAEEIVADGERLAQMLETAIRQSGVAPFRMTSGAGHDAMIMAERMPAAMVFLQSPGGVSHHPTETVRQQDVVDALGASLEFLALLQDAKDIYA